MPRQGHEIHKKAEQTEEQTLSFTPHAVIYYRDKKVALTPPGMLHSMLHSRRAAAAFPLRNAVLHQSLHQPQWRRAFAALPPSRREGEPPQEAYERRANSFAYKAGGLLGRGVAAVQRQAQETGALDAATKLKDDGFKAAGVDKATGDTALKAAGGLWLLARTVHKVRKVAVGAVVAGAAYGVARAHSPQTADKVLEVGKAGLEKGNVIGSSFWSGVSKGMGETTAGAEFDDDNVRVTTTGSGWGGSGSIEHLLKRDVRGLAPGSYAGYAEAMRSEGYDSVAMLRSLAQSSSSSDWTRMVDACGIRAGDALKIKRALLDKQP